MKIDDVVDATEPVPTTSQTAAPTSRTSRGGRSGHVRLTGVLKNFIGPVVLVGTWQFVSVTGITDRGFLPPPTDVVTRMAEMINDGTLWKHLQASLIRVGGGVILALVLGALLGVLMGMSRLVEDLVSPVIELIRPISPIAWIPLAILWFGLGNGVAWFVVFLASFFPIVTNVHKGVQAVATNQLRAAACCGMNGWTLARKVIIPSALPDAMAGLRVGVGIGWMAVITAELVAAQSGFGYFIWTARQVFDATGVLAGMVSIGITGLAINGALLAIERRVTRWRYAGGHR